MYSPLAQAARALAAPADAADIDDATLLALIAPALVPALGELAALLTIGPGGTATVAAVAPPAAALWTTLAPAACAEIVATGRPRIVAVPGATAAMAAPLGTGDAGSYDALLLLGATGPGRAYADDDLALLDVLAALLTARRAGRELARREAALRRQVDAGARAGRLLAHRLNNDLTMPVGVVELLLDRGTAGSELQEMLEAASKDLASIEQHIQEFHNEMRALASSEAAPRPAGAFGSDPSRPPPR
jgi:hypothetical protein